MFKEFGWKAVTGILIANIIYWAVFRREFLRIEKQKPFTAEELPHPQKKIKIPTWVTLVHILFIVWTILSSHYPAVFIASFLMFLGFHHATMPHQYAHNLKRPLLVGFFLAGLIVHGDLQGWWITPLMQSFSETTVMVLGVVLTAFNDNAAVAYLTSQIPDLSDSFKYAIISGVVTGGGLTVIANAPNPAGYVILSDHFKKGISPIKLFLGALLPTVIFFTLFYLCLIGGM